MNSNKKLVFKTNPYIISNKGFSTIEFKFIYPCKYNKNYMFYLSLLRQLLLTTSKRYKTEKEYNDAYNKTFIISSRLNTYAFNNNLFFEFTLIVPDPKKVKNFDIDVALNFFIDTIYNPNIINEQFDIDCFNREKRFLVEDINNRIKNIDVKAYQSFINIVDDIGMLKDNIYNNLNLVDEANPKELYNVYKQNIINNKPVIIVYGDVDNEINNLIKKYIKLEDGDIIVEKDYANYLKPSRKLKLVEEMSDSNKSILYMAYKVKDMKEDDELYLGLIKNILSSGSNDLIFKELRMDKKLIYSSSVWMKKKSGLLVVESYINNCSKEKTIGSVKKVLKSLKNEELLLSYLEKLIADLEYHLIRSKDSRIKKLNDFIDEKFEFMYTLDVVLEKYKNIDMKKLLNFIDRLVLDTIYFLRGEFNEEK